MIDAIPAMAWSGLPDGSVEFANQRWHDYTGLSAEDLRWFYGNRPESTGRLLACASRLVVVLLLLRLRLKCCLPGKEDLSATTGVVGLSQIDGVHVAVATEHESVSLCALVVVDARRGRSRGGHVGACLHAERWVVDRT
jgi:hypothetical protein